MDWIDTNSLISICTFAIGLTQFLFWRYIAKQKSYETEKGKNLATKEDIGEITKEIESVKRNFTDNTNSFKGLAEQLESFKEILVALDIKLKDLGNDFVSKNYLSETQIEEVKDINHKLVSEFVNGTGLPFIGTK